MTALNSLVHQVEGNWEEIKGKVKRRWGKLTDSDLKKIEGSYDQLTGKLMEVYGYTEDEVEDKLIIFVDKLNLKNIEHTADNAQDLIADNVEKAWGAVKKKTEDWQEGIYCYIKGNPAKALGTAGLTLVLGLTVWKFINSK